MTHEEAIEMRQLLKDNGIDPVMLMPPRGTRAGWWITYWKPSQHFPYVFDTAEQVEQAIAIRKHSTVVTQWMSVSSHPAQHASTLELSR